MAKEREYGGQAPKVPTMQEKAKFFLVLQPPPCGVMTINYLKHEF